MPSPNTKPKAAPAASDAEPMLRGYAAIGAVLSELLGFHVSEDSAYRLASRRVHPLPTHGFTGRVLARRSELQAWCEREAVRTCRGPSSGVRGGTP